MMPYPTSGNADDIHVHQCKQFTCICLQHWLILWVFYLFWGYALSADLISGNASNMSINANNVQTFTISVDYPQYLCILYLVSVCRSKWQYGVCIYIFILIYFQRHIIGDFSHEKLGCLPHGKPAIWESCACQPSNLFIPNVSRLSSHSARAMCFHCCGV